MHDKTKILDDIAQLAGGAVSLAGGLKSNIHEDIKSRTDAIADRLDLVPREDFDTLKAMLEQSRIEQDALKKRIEALEGKAK